MDATQTAMAAVLLGLGGYVAVLNWAAVIVTARTGKFHSMVPLFGAAFLAAGALLVPTLRPYAWVAPLADIGTASLVLAAPLLVRQFWTTARFNLTGEYTGRRGGVTVRVRLYRGGAALLRFRVERPAGELGLVELGLVGDWEQDGRAVVLRVCGDRGVLEPIPGDDGRYRVVGLSPHPQCPGVSFDGLKLIRTRGGR
ncbi:MAG: hypothetical protein K2X82_05775 [Gemmataceae bacterium]|nr:hypothetical protein [Gemmataceae bacterium]